MIEICTHYQVGSVDQRCLACGRQEVNVSTGYVVIHGVHTLYQAEVARRERMAEDIEKAAKDQAQQTFDRAIGEKSEQGRSALQPRNDQRAGADQVLGSGDG